MSTVYPWQRLLGPAVLRPEPAAPMTSADRERAVLAAVKAGHGRTKTCIHHAVGGNKRSTLRTIDDLVSSGVLRRGSDGYRVTT